MKFLEDFKIKPLPLCIYSYIALPFLIFAAGFLKWYFAIPFSIITIFSVILASSASNGLDKIDFLKRDILKLILGFLFISSIVLLSGIGGYLWQNSDHATRNTLFKILTEYPWPPVSNNGSVGIVYYIGFWLPAALIGKLTSLSVGFLFQVVWAILGMFLIWLILCSFHKRIVIYPLIIFLFFSGLDIFGYTLVTHTFSNLARIQIGKWASFGNIFATYHIEWWPRYYQFSSHITQLFWVFNQALPIWLITLTLLSEKNNKNLVFLMGLSLLSSTLPFIGLIPIFFWCAMTDYNEQIPARAFTKTPLSSFLSLFTFQNILGGGISGIVSFIYLSNNIASANTQAASSAAAASIDPFKNPKFYVLCILMIASCAAVFFLSHKGDPKKAYVLLISLPLMLAAYKYFSVSALRQSYFLLFLIFEILALIIPLFPAYGKTSLYYVISLSLILIPFFKVGKSIDFCMRVSIPALCVLSLMTIFALSKYVKEKRIISFIIIIAVLVCGAITPMHEISRTVLTSYDRYTKKGEIVNAEKKESSVFGGGNFTGKTEDSLFFEIFAK